MARIPDGTFKEWKDNDVISASDYKMEREVLRAAINDLDSLLKTADPNSFGSRLIEVEKNYLKKVDKKFVQIASYANDWQARTNEPFMAYLDANGIVHLKGIMSWGLVKEGTPMLVDIPQEFRPPRSMVLPAMWYYSRDRVDVLGSVTMHASGIMTVAYLPDNTSVKFDGISYPTF